VLPWLERAVAALPLPYGIDAPYAPAGLIAGGAGMAALGLRRPRWLAPAAMCLASAGVYLHTTVRGKLRVWERELDRVGLHGDEHLLDLGCGRGAVLIAAARRLPSGRAIGIDLWRGQDQSGNDPATTWGNAEDAGVAARVELHSADMTRLPFPDGRFDVVTSALAIHNIPTAAGRLRALDEALRVLRPGGHLLLADWHQTARDYQRHLGPTAASRPLGPSYWYGGPWAATTMITMPKT
jgi:SAM-dependent methyltransferase